MIKIQKYQSIFLKPHRIVEPISWIKHIPFAFFITQLLKPKIIVELGVHTGNSFSAFCQAVKELNITASCYGIDSFKGDPHAGFYDENIFLEINHYIIENYGDFAQIMKMNFDDALTYFNDRSIDLLHIDGYHTYEAVKHDFEAWLPKMSNKGVILLHDTQVRRDNFGVWKLWEEICKLYPSYEFRFGYGLGVLAVGKDVPAEVIDFINEAKKDVFIEYLFSTLGSNIEQNYTIKQKHIIITELKSTLQDLKEIRTQKDREIKEVIAQKDREIKEIETEKLKIFEELNIIKSTLSWQLITKFHSLIDKTLPIGTKRRRYYELGKSILKIIINEGWKALWHKFKQYIYEQNVIRSVENQIIPFRQKSLRNFPKISIIIVTYNSEKTITKLLDSILQSSYPTEAIEVIVVDNNSQDKTKDLILSFAAEHQNQLYIKLIINKKNYGFGKAVNRGVKQSDSDYVLLLNPDCQLFKETINELISIALSTKQHGFCLWEARQVPFEHPKIYNPVTLEVTWSSAACCLIHKKTFEEIGGFDENIFLYLEDVDLSWRFRLNGYKLMYVPFAKVFHDTYEDLTTVKSPQYYNSLLYQFYLRYKYGRLSDVLIYYPRFLYLIAKAPNNLPKERLNLAKQFIKHYFLIPDAILFRIKNRKKLNSFKPLFLNLDFEVHRLGADVKYIGFEKANNLPLVSIIIRTIGRKGFLKEALTSVRNQTYSPIEVVVIEDGPNSVEDMLRAEFSDMDIKYFSLEKRCGRSVAGNFGLSKCQGEYICFLDEDDLLYSDYVETMISFILNNEDKYMLAYSIAFEVPTEVISDEPLKYIEYDYKIIHNEDFDKAALLNHNFIPIQCAFFHRELYEKLGGFDENLEYLEDWDLWIKYSSYTDFLKVPKILSLYRIPANKELQKERQERLDNYYYIVKNKWEKRGFM